MAERSNETPITSSPPALPKLTLQLDNPLATMPGHTIKRADEAYTPVAIVHRGGSIQTRAEQVRYAMMFRAAPEMLKSHQHILREATGILGQLKPGTQLHTHIKFIADEASAAIKKAESAR